MLLTNRRAALGAHLGVWLFMSVFFLVVLSWNFPVVEALTLSFGNFALLAAVFYGHVWLVDRYYEKAQYGQFFIRGFLLFTLVCTVRYFMHAVILTKYLVSEGVLVVSPEGRLGLFVLATSFIFAVVGVIYRLLLNRYRREMDNLALLAEKQAAELQLLKAQINPHFLFNALNNLYSLVVVGSPQAAPMLVKLSGLLRYVIYESQKNKADLSQEIQEIRNFIELFSMQHAVKPDISLNIAGRVETCQIEPMLLIPLVENCFKHTDFSKNPKAYCRINLEILPGPVLEMTTENTFNPNDQQKDKVGGVGLENMRRRLQLLYPDDHTLEYSSRDQVFHVRLVTPILKGAAHN